MSERVGARRIRRRSHVRPTICTALLAIAAVLAGWAFAPRFAGAAPEEATLRIETDRREVAPGEPFEIAVHRGWPKERTPEPWDDKLLSPLVVHPLDNAINTTDGRVHETRRFRAYAFTLNDVRIPARTLRLEGRESEARSLPLRIRVRGVLNPNAPGAPEMPGPFRLAERSAAPRVLVCLAVAVLALMALLVWRRRQRQRTANPPPAIATAPAIDPGERARARLLALEQAPANTPGERHDALVGIAHVVRDYVGDVHGIDAHARTSQELLCAIKPAEGTSPPTSISPLTRLLRSADQAKFAAMPTNAETLQQAFEHGYAVVTPKAPRPTSTASGGR